MGGAEPSHGPLQVANEESKILTKEKDAKFAVKLCTVNATSLKSLKKFVSTTTAHVILAQETHTYGQASADAAKWFKQRAPEAAVALAPSSPRSKCKRCGLAGHNKTSCPKVRQEAEDY